MSAATPGDLQWLDRVARGVVRYWLLLLNAAVITYATLPWLAPLLEGAGYTRLGHLIFRLYSAVCHQLPERSFFVGRYQVCYCHRCTAIYSTLALVGVAFGIIRWRWALSTRLLGWAAVPILIDGLWHIADDLAPGWGLRSAANGVDSVSFWARMLTGMLFAAAAGLWLYPRFAAELREL